MVEGHLDVRVQCDAHPLDALLNSAPSREPEVAAALRGEC